MQGHFPCVIVVCTCSNELGNSKECWGIGVYCVGGPVWVCIVLKYVCFNSNATFYLELIILLVTQSYVSILYLRMPPGFRIILRGQEVQHHNLVDDLMYAQELTYRPQSGADHVSRETDVSVIVKYFVDAGWNEIGYLLTLH